MQKNQQAEFVTAIQALASAFRIEPSEAMFEGFWLALDDLELAAVRGAVKRALRECKFMPSANELRQLAGEMRPEHRAVAAWDAFEAAVTRIGGYRSVTFDDPFINATIRSLGGWQRLCEMNPEQFDTFLRKDFERIYQALYQSGISEDRAAPLLGIHASDAARDGGQLPAPVQVRTGLPAPLPQLMRPSLAGQVTTHRDRAGGPARIGQIIDVMPMPTEDKP